MSVQEEYWENIEGKTIVAIEAVPILSGDPGLSLFDTIDFYVEGSRLRLGTNVDTDEITISIEACSLQDLGDKQAGTLKILEGKRFFWLWLAENSQGYMDTVMMSFSVSESDDGSSLEPAVPQLAFVGASGIQVLSLSKLRA